MKKQIITSENNELIKYVKALQFKKYRMKYRQFVVEGLRVVKECFEKDIPVAYCLYSDGLKKVKDGIELIEKIKAKEKTYQISDHLFTQVSQTESPQGILAVVDMPQNSLDDFDFNKNLFIIILDRIQDPGNMGTIIRTAESAKADAVILTKGCVDPFNDKVVRSTMGALFHIPIIQCDHHEEWIQLLKRNHVKLIASSLDAEDTYFDIEYNGNIGIIIGNEANGIGDELIQESDYKVKIPIWGKVESLNASVAAGILIYKAAEYRYLRNR